VDAWGTGIIHVSEKVEQSSVKCHAIDKFYNLELINVYFWNFPFNIFKMQLTMGN
jgi:hypothetical protein